MEIECYEVEGYKVEIYDINGFLISEASFDTEEEVLECLEEYKGAKFIARQIRRMIVREG